MSHDPSFLHVLNPRFNANLGAGAASSSVLPVGTRDGEAAPNKYSVSFPSEPEFINSALSDAEFSSGPALLSGTIPSSMNSGAPINSVPVLV